MQLARNLHGGQGAVFLMNLRQLGSNAMKLLCLLAGLIYNLELIGILYANDRLEPHLVLLQKAPSWASISPDDIDSEGEILVETLLPILELDTQTIRSLLVAYLASKTCRDGGIGDEHLTTDCLSTAFILNRMVWKIPEEIPTPYPPGFGGFLMPEVIYSDPVKRMLWPFNEDEHGKFFIEGKCEGHMGPLYQAIEEFDFFSEHFERRQALDFSREP